MAGREAGNGGVTLAVLSTKLDTVIANQEELKRGQLVDHDRIARLEGELGRLRDRQSVVTMGLTAFNVVVANLAAWLWART